MLPTNNIEGLSISRSSVVRTLNMNQLRPHKFRMWLHSIDPEFKEKVNEIVDLYLNPPEDAVVLSINEKQKCRRQKEKTKRLCPNTERLENTNMNISVTVHND